MTPLTGIDIRRAARHLHWPERNLRQHLQQLGAIRKTAYGYEAAPGYRGLFSTQTRQHTVVSETGQHINRYYTVVLVTGDGLAWLRNAAPGATPTEATA